MGAVVVVYGGDDSSGFDSAFSFHWIHADQIQGELFQRGQIVRGVACAGAHLIVVEGKISMHHCKRFSTDQWARSVAAILAPSGARLRMYNRCSCVVLPPAARLRLFFMRWPFEGQLL